MNEEKRCNDLTGKEWLQNSFSIWRDLSKTKAEKDLKHPASYPVCLCEKLIKTFARKKCKVLDPFNGIGSTIVAANNLGCEAVGIDLSSEFCSIAEHRIAQQKLNSSSDSDIKIINGDSFQVLKSLPENYFDSSFKLSSVIKITDKLILLSCFSASSFNASNSLNVFSLSIYISSLNGL